MPPSFPPAVRQHYSGVPVLYELLRAEEEGSRVWLRDEMNQIADPLIDSLFFGLILSSSSSVVAQSRSTVSELCKQLEGEKVKMRTVLSGEMNRLTDSLFERLTNKLMYNTDLDRSENGGDRAQMGNQLDHIESPNLNSHQPSSPIRQQSTSTFSTDCQQPHSNGDELESNTVKMIEIKEEAEDEDESRVIDIEGLTEDNQGDGGESRSGANARTKTTLQMDCYEPEIKGEFDYELEIEIKQKEDDETTNNEEEEEEEEGVDEIRVNETEISPMVTTPPHPIGQYQVNRQTRRIEKRKKTDKEPSPQVQNQVNNQEDKEDEDDDEEVTSRSVKRARPSHPATSSSTKETQIITLARQCPQVGCELMFPKDQFNAHMWNCHSIGPFQCAVKDCKESFDDTILLRQHIAQFHHSIAQWDCDKCSKQFAKYHVLAIHKYQYHQLGQFQCSFPSCTFTAEFRRTVFNHAKEHMQTLKCQHSGCHYETQNAADMKKHERTHSGIKPYRCTWPQCEYASTRRFDTVSHIRRRHLAPNPSSASNGAQLDPQDYVEVVHELL